MATNIARLAEVDREVTADEREDFNTQFDKAAITSAERAAEIILNGAAKGKRRVLIGRDAKVVSFIQRMFPASYWGKLSMLLPQNLLK